MNAARSSGRVSLSRPLWARPTGVRTAVVITTSLIEVPFGSRPLRLAAPRQRGPSGRSERVPGADEDSSVLQVGHFGALALALVPARLRQRAADAELWTHDPLGPDDGL